MSILDPKPPTRAELTATYAPAVGSDNYAANDVPAIPFSAGNKAKMISYGHSFLAEQGLADPSKYWARRLASALGLTYPTSDGGTTDDLKRAVGGSAVEAVSARVLGTTAGFTPGTSGLVVVEALINSARYLGVNAVAQTSATNALRSILATLNASSRIEETDASLTYSGAGWQSQTINLASGGTWKFTTAIGDYVQFTAPTQPAYVIIAGKQGTGGCLLDVIDVTAANTVLASLDMSNQCVAPPAGQPSTSVSYAYKIPTSAQGHIIQFKKTGGNSLTFDVILPQSATPPPVLMMKEPYLANYAASTAFPNGSDAAIDAFNAIIDTIAAEFPNVIVADPNKAGYWDKNKHTQSDQVHPNEAGNAALARAAYDAVRAWQARGRILNAPLGRNELTATFGAFLNFTDPRVGGVGDAFTDNTAAFNRALAILAPTGGTLFFPAGVYVINGTTDPVPGGVWLTGTGYDYHTPSVTADRPRLMSVIRAGATMARLIQLGTDATVSTSGSTGASIRTLVVDGNNLAQTAVKTAGRRNRILDAQVYFGTVNALWIAGQNTHVVGCVIAQQDTGDVVLINGYYDNKIWDSQIRQPGTTGACIHLVGGGSDQTDIQRNHLWAGANAIAAAAKALIWLEATSSNGVINTLIQDNTIEGVLGPEILLQGTAGSAGIRGAVITGNRFYQNTNMPSDNTYAVVDSSGASLSSIVIANNVINGNTATLRYKSILNLGAAITATSRITILGNVGLYVASVLSGIAAPTPIYQRANQINNGTANVRSDNSGQATLSGTGSATAFTIAHGLASVPSSVRVTPGSAAAATPFYVTSDATNITVTFTTAPASGTNNVVLNWNADA